MAKPKLIEDIENLQTLTEGHTSQLADMSHNPRNFGAKFDGVTDDTSSINATLSYMDANGGGVCILPPKKIRVDGTIIVPRGVSLMGADKGFQKGTILWRNENINNGLPMIKIGVGNSTPFVRIENITLVGDSQDSSCHGIVNNSVGMHGLILSNIQFNCFAGTPIIIDSNTDISRSQFITIDGITVGMDWDTYKTGIKSACSNSNCIGVLLRGNCDGVYIKNSQFVGIQLDSVDLNNNLNLLTAYGIKIENESDTLIAGDNFKVENCHFGNCLSAIYSEAREILISNNYIEHSNTCVTIKAKSQGMVGCNVFSIQNNYFSACKTCIDIQDLSTNKTRSAQGTIANNFTFNKVTTTGIDFLKLLPSSPYSMIFCHNNGFSELVESSTKIRFFASGSDKTGVFGHVQLDTANQTLKFDLNEPVIYSTVSKGNFGYKLIPNTSTTADYGLDIYKTNGNRRLANFADTAHTFYYYDTVGNLKTAYNSTSTGELVCPNNIILNDFNNKKNKLIIGNSGQITSIQLNNKITNGNFADATSWAGNGCTVSVANNECTTTLTATGTSTGLYRTSITGITTGHKIYIKATFYPKYGNSFSIGFEDTRTTVSNSLSNTWVAASCIVTKSTSNVLNLYHNTSSSYVIGDTFKIRNVIIINLTEMFGSGLEPTQSWCDSNINFNSVNM